MKPQPSGTGYDILTDLPGDVRIPAERKRAEARRPERRPEPVRIGEPMPWQLPHNLVVPDLPSDRKKPTRY
jgi:hypothetical protein